MSILNRILSCFVGSNDKPASSLPQTPEMKALLQEVFSGLDPSRILDSHCHVLGTGEGVSNSGCFLHPKAYDMCCSIPTYMKIRAMKVASGIAEKKDMDREYVLRLREMVLEAGPASASGSASGTSGSASGGGKKLHLKCLLLAFDQVYDENGQPNLQKTTMHIPNDWVLKSAREFPEEFEAAGSVHPYRLDALQELERLKSLGVKVIKWLPNAMRIDPSHPKCVPFFKKMKELDLVLLSHTGQENSVDAGGLDQSLGNPLLLRHPLDCGVKVIAAHCASEGHNHDLDTNPPSRDRGGWLALVVLPVFWSIFHQSWTAVALTLLLAAVGLLGWLVVEFFYRPSTETLAGIRHPDWPENFKLFCRLMDDSKYENLLFADISALLITKRIPFLAQILDKTHWHPRLCFGTDYPLPCVKLLTLTTLMHRQGLLREEHVHLLNIIWEFNPLLYDFAVKRLIRSPSGNKFSDCIFQKPKWLV